MDILKNQITHLKNGNFLPVPSAFSYKDPTENSFWSLFRKMLKLSLVLNGVVSGRYVEDYCPFVFVFSYLSFCLTPPPQKKKEVKTSVFNNFIVHSQSAYIFNRGLNREPVRNEVNDRFLSVFWFCFVFFINSSFFQVVAGEKAK